MEKKVLFVDDEEGILITLECLFSSNGYAVQCARSGKEALEIMKRDGDPATEAFAELPS